MSEGNGEANAYTEVFEALNDRIQQITETEMPDPEDLLEFISNLSNDEVNYVTMIIVQAKLDAAEEIYASAQARLGQEQADYMSGKKAN